jgi:hypothetical protein
MAQLLSVNVERPQEIAWRGKTVYTSVWKAPVQGRRLVRRLNVDGDAQGDLHGHGGEHRAVFVYQMDSYRYWERELKRSDFTFGQFGENFTVEGLADSEVCVGDRYRIGGALFEVTQPRVTCYRVGIRMEEPRMGACCVVKPSTMRRGHARRSRGAANGRRRWIGARSDHGAQLDRSRVRGDKEVEEWMVSRQPAWVSTSGGGSFIKSRSFRAMGDKRIVP